MDMPAGALDPSIPKRILDRAIKEPTKWTQYWLLCWLRSARVLATHAKHLRDHITSLSGKKHQDALEGSPGFVIMFVPIEACLSAALSSDPTLLDYGVHKNVVIATPTTWITLLWAVYAGMAAREPS